MKTIMFIAFLLIVVVVCAAALAPEGAWSGKNVPVVGQAAQTLQSVPFSEAGKVPVLAGVVNDFSSGKGKEMGGKFMKVAVFFGQVAVEIESWFE